MSDALVQLRNACSPGTPATPEQYVDCTSVRGGNVFASKVQADLIGHPVYTDKKALPTKKGFLHYLFSGHVGSGKSSELLHLKACLERDVVGAEQERFFTIVIDASEYLDEYDVKALDILLCGKVMGPEEALAIGLVNRVIEPENFMAEVMAFANKLAAGAGKAMGSIKAAVYEGMDLPMELALAVERRYARENCSTDDAREGLTAFAEKRKPNFTSR